MFPMTITVHTAAQLNAVLHAMQPDLDAGDFKDPIVDKAYVEVAQRVADAKPAPAPATGKPATTADTARTAAEAKADAPAPKVESSGQPSPVATYDDVKRAILELSKKKGRDAAVKVLSEFGVASGPELQKTPEKFGAFVESAKVALEA